MTVRKDYKFYINKNSTFMVDLEDIRSITYHQGSRNPWTIVYKDNSKEQVGLDIAGPLIKYLKGRTK